MNLKSPEALGPKKRLAAATGRSMSVAPFRISSHDTIIPVRSSVSNADTEARSLGARPGLIRQPLKTSRQSFESYTGRGGTACGRGSAL